MVVIGTRHAHPALDDPTKGSVLGARLPKGMTQTPTNTPLAATAVDLPSQRTGTCFKQGERFKKSQALKWIEEVCENADENQSSDNWFSKGNTMVQIEGNKIYNVDDQTIRS